MKYTADTFRSLVGQTLSARIGADAAFELDVTSVSDSGPGAGRTPGFLVRFRSHDTVVRDQATYDLSHPALGADPMPVFIVPSGVESDGRVVYVAAFTFAIPHTSDTSDTSDTSADPLTHQN